MRSAAVLFVAVAILAAVPAVGEDLPPSERYGGDLRVALPSAPNLDPAQFRANRLVQEVAYEALVRIGPDERPVGSLAQIWTLQPGPSITFDLRSAHWPDGTPITANDVAWSFQKHVTNGLVSGISPTVIDVDTVRFSTSAVGDFVERVATLPVAWRDQQATATLNGPYASPSSTSTVLNLTANAQHWSGRPSFDRLVFRFPYTLDKNSDGTTRPNDAACALMFRDVDIIGWPLAQAQMNAQRDCTAGFGGFGGGNRTLSDPTRLVPHLGSIDSPSQLFHFLGMNTQRAPLNDPLLRQAISRSVDRDSIVGTYGGASEFENADIADSPIPTANVLWFNPDVPKYRVPRTISGGDDVPNLEQVNRFLDTLGYLDRDGDSWRDEPSGQPFGFTLLTYDMANDSSSGKYQNLAGNLNAIGINATAREMTPPALRSTVASDDFDLFVDTVEVRGEPSFLWDMFHSAGSANMVDVNSAELDLYLETARSAIDPAVRLQAVFDAQTWIGVNAPIAPILHYRAANALDRESFDGWSGSLGGVVNFWSLTQAHYTRRLTVSVEALDNGLRSRETTTLSVHVLDSAGDPVEGAAVRLDGPGLESPDGVTDSTGLYRTIFAAPEVESDQDVAITAEVTTVGYAPGNATAIVTVHAGAREFTITLTKGASVVESGDETFVRVIVRDRENATFVRGATVSFTVSPSGVGGAVDLVTGTTNAQGLYETTFRGDTGSLTRFLITATVSLDGYANETATTSLEVLPGAGSAPPTPALDTISMVAVVVVLSLLYGAWQRRKWIARKP